eukprot:3633933-Rhodomonas_salina.1
MVSRSALVVALLCFVVHAIASDSESAAEVNFGFSEEANADTVTGYTWTLYSADTGMQVSLQDCLSLLATVRWLTGSEIRIEQKTGSSFKPPSKQLIGAGGIQQYFFKAAAVGTHKLQFVYTYVPDPFISCPDQQL